MESNQFGGAAKYVLDQELAKIVNISIALEMPLLLKGEPGTGKLCWPMRLQIHSGCRL